MDDPDARGRQGRGPATTSALVTSDTASTTIMEKPSCALARRYVLLMEIIGSDTPPCL